MMTESIISREVHMKVYQRLLSINGALESLIHLVPTSPARNALTEQHICLLDLQERALMGRLNEPCITALEAAIKIQEPL